MIELLDFLVGSLFGLIVGITTSVLSLNHSHDSKTCEHAIDKIDGVISVFHQRYSAPAKNQTTAAQMLDYQMKGLFGDPTLLPIIGRTVFENQYTVYLGELFDLSTFHPRDFATKAEVDEHINKANAVGVKLKRIVYSTSGHLRLLPKK